MIDVVRPRIMHTIARWFLIVIACLCGYVGIYTACIYAQPSFINNGNGYSKWFVIMTWPCMQVDSYTSYILFSGPHSGKCTILKWNTKYNEVEISQDPIQFLSDLTPMAKIQYDEIVTRQGVKVVDIEVDTTLSTDHCIRPYRKWVITAVKLRN